MRRISFTFCLLAVCLLRISAQIGEYRNDLSIGVNGGYVLSNVGFVPKVTQGMHDGITGGLSVRYVCEKYFKSVCSIYAEVNYAQIGWKENILNIKDEAVINPVTKMAEQYSRTINYIQVPVFARMGWGRENRGFQFFAQVGPQFGYYLSESTKTNFDFDSRNMTDRASVTVAQDTMSVENKFDYGIAGGIGVEYSVPKVGHFLVEARYYYGLGNIYGNSKRDFFSKSNYGNIAFKVAYLFDITRTRDVKRK